MTDFADLKALRETIDARIAQETLSIEETCETLHIGSDRYYRLVRDGILTPVLYRGRKRVSKAQVDAYLHAPEEEQQAVADLASALSSSSWSERRGAVIVTNSATGEYCLSLSEAARQLGVSREVCRRLCSIDVIDYKRGGQRLYLSMRSVCELADAQARWTPAEIRRCREEAGMSAAELGQRIGVTRASVNYWETGQFVPKLERLARLHEALRAIPRATVATAKVNGQSL